MFQQAPNAPLVEVGTSLPFFPKRGNRIVLSAVYFIVARQFFIPLALLSVFPLTVAILFSLGGDDTESTDPEKESVASESSEMSVEEG